jgi:hypothetical protein
MGWSGTWTKGPAEYVLARAGAAEARAAIDANASGKGTRKPFLKMLVPPFHDSDHRVLWEPGAGSFSYIPMLGIGSSQPRDSLSLTVGTEAVN